MSGGSRECRIDGRLGRRHSKFDLKGPSVSPRPELAHIDFEQSAVSFVSSLRSPVPTDAVQELLLLSQRRRSRKAAVAAYFFSGTQVVLALS